MVRNRRILATLGVATLTGVVVRHLRGHTRERSVGSGILIGNTHSYDRLTRSLLGSFFDGIASDVAVSAPPRSRVLEVGCGPGHLSIRLAHDHGLDVIGTDLDPAMIERARANMAALDQDSSLPLSFRVGDAASLPFDDGSFDLVVSTLSMHHWADPSAGLNEIRRVLRPGGRSLIWDLRPALIRLHARVPEAAVTAAGSGLQMVASTPWPWPWRLAPTQRLELARKDEDAV